MKFCDECDNKLDYIEKEDGLYKVCKTCKHQSKFTGRLIDKNVYKRNNVEISDSDKYKIYDNTLPHTTRVECRKEDCPTRKNKNLTDVIFYDEDYRLKPIYICGVCKTKWTYS